PYRRHHPRHHHRFFLLKLEGIALDSEVEIADGKTGDDVADGAAGKVNIQPLNPGQFLNQTYSTLLFRREPGFHGVDVISHSSCLQPFSKGPVGALRAST